MIIKKQNSKCAEIKRRPSKIKLENRSGEKQQPF